MALVWPRIAPNIELVGITTVGGNVALARATRNALALLEYAGRQDLPVAQGASRPLSGRYGYSHKFHGQTGLSRRLPRPTSRAINASAVEYLAHQQRSRGEWVEEEFTGTGFPEAFYLRYHYYCIYFPLLALGRFRNALLRSG